MSFDFRTRKRNRHNYEPPPLYDYPYQIIYFFLSSNYWSFFFFFFFFFFFL